MHFDAGKYFLQLTVENLSYIGRLTKDAARHRHGKLVDGSLVYGEFSRSSFRRSARCKSSDYGGGQLRQLASGVIQNLARKRVSLIGSAQDDGKQSCELGAWRWLALRVRRCWRASMLGEPAL